MARLTLPHEEDPVNKILGAVFAVLIGFGMSIPDSEAARRLGGGKSFGAQAPTEAVVQKMADTPSSTAP